MRPEIRGLQKHFLSIKDHAEELRADVTPSHPANNEVRSILTEYNDAMNNFAKIMEREKVPATLRDMRFIGPSQDVGNNRAILQMAEMECEKAAGVLGSIVSPLPAEELDKLQSLRRELEAMTSGIEDAYSMNVSQAVDEYEKGDHLASVLIASRVIVCALEGIRGANDDEKLRILQEKGIVDKKREDIQRSIVKASRKARNFFSHDIKAIPTAAEALSLLGDTLSILGIVAKLEAASKSQTVGGANR